MEEAFSDYHKDWIDWLKSKKYFFGVFDTLLINAVPSVLQEETISNSIDEIFSTIAYQEIEKGDLAHTLIGSIAKSASLKKLNLSTDEMIQSLIDQLFQCENHTYSPRNKKIIETISLDEIHQKLK